MNHLTKTIKVVSIFLAACFVLVGLSNGQKRGKIKGYWMDVIISPDDSLCAGTDPVLDVDTRNGCRGAFIPYDNKHLYINTLEHCFDLPEPLFAGSDIIVQSVEVGCQRDRRTGEILGVHLWFKDTEQNYYRTDIVELVYPVVPDPNGFFIPISQCLEIHPQTKKGKKVAAGFLSVGTIEFWPK